MAGGKGAAVLIQRGIMQYRQSFLFSLQANNYFNAGLALINMASILPKEAKFREKIQPLIDSMPKQVVENDSLTIENKKALKKWMLDNAPMIEQVISDYVYNFYRKGGSNF